MPPSSAQYTVSIATDAVASIFVPPKMLEGESGANVWACRKASAINSCSRAIPGGHVRKITQKGKTLLSPEAIASVRHRHQHEVSLSTGATFDPFEPELGEDGGERRERGGPESPVEPVGVARHASIAAWPARRESRSGGELPHAYVARPP